MVMEGSARSPTPASCAMGMIPCACAGMTAVGCSWASAPSTLRSSINFGVNEVVVASFLGTLLLRLCDDHWFGHLGGARRGDGRSKHLNVSWTYRYN